jgi:hypothetical protein
MGLFSSRQTTPPVDIDRMRRLFNEHFGAIPSLSGVIDDVSAQTGVATDQFDGQAMLTEIYNAFTNLAGYAGDTSKRPDVRSRLDDTFRRSDFDEDQLWDTLLSYGPTGVAMASFVATSINDGTISRILCDKVQAGELLNPTRVVSNPGQGDGDLKQISYAVMGASGFYSVVHGDGTANELIDALVDVAPELARSDVGNPIARLGEGAYWVIYTTPAGSAAVIFFDPERDPTIVHTLHDAIDTIGGRWSHGHGARTAVPNGAFETIEFGEVIYPSTLDRFAPTGDRANRQRLRRIVENAGFAEISHILYKGTFPASNGRTQLIWLGFDDELKAMSPISHAADGSVPDYLANQDFGHYVVSAVASFVLLEHRLRYDIVEDGLRQALLALAQYADTWEQHLGGDDDEL